MLSLSYSTVKDWGRRIRNGRVRIEIGNGTGNEIVQVTKHVLNLENLQGNKKAKHGCRLIRHPSKSTAQTFEMTRSSIEFSLMYTVQMFRNMF